MEAAGRKRKRKGRAGRGVGGHGGGRGGGGLRALPAELPAEGEAMAGQSGGSVGGGCRERALRGLPCRTVPFAGAVLREAVRLPAVPRRRRGAPAGPVPRGRGAVHPLPPSAEGGSGGVGRGRRHFGGGAAAMLGRGGGVSVPRFTAVSPVLLSSPVRRQAQQRCEGCHSLFGEYYCGICHLFDRDKKQYHCAECGICRYVRGGRDPRAGPCP